MKIETVYKWIVGVSSVLNYQNNAVLQFFPPIFTELALEQGVSPTGIGVILAMYSVGIVIQSFKMDALHTKLGSKPTYILGVSSGAVVSLLAVTLNYSSFKLFICAAVVLRFIDGTREAQFESVAFVYFAENVLG